MRKMTEKQRQAEDREHLRTARASLFFMIIYLIVLFGGVYLFIKLVS